MAPIRGFGPLALLSGTVSVKEAMDNEAASKFLNRMLETEIIPYLSLPTSRALTHSVQRCCAGLPIRSFCIAGMISRSMGWPSSTPAICRALKAPWLQRGSRRVA